MYPRIYLFRSPDPVQRTVRQIEAGIGGPVNIRGILTLLF